MVVLELKTVIIYKFSFNQVNIVLNRLIIYIIIFTFHKLPQKHFNRTFLHLDLCYLILNHLNVILNSTVIEFSLVFGTGVAVFKFINLINRTYLCFFSTSQMPSSTEELLVGLIKFTTNTMLHNLQINLYSLELV